MIRKFQRPILVGAAAVALMLALVAVAAPNPPNPARTAGASPGVAKAAAHVVHSPLGSGTIQYDNDTPFNRLGTDGGTVGNRFNPGAGTHSVATVSFAVAGNYANSVVMTIWDINAGTAQVLARELVTGIPQSPASALRFTAAVATPVVGHSGSFIAGIRNTDYDPCAGSTNLGSTCDGVALTQGTSPPPPVASRAARIPFTSGVFVPTITQVNSTGSNIPGVNAIFRVTGDNLPIELMEFTVN
jgi:hypothetical protein